MYLKLQPYKQLSISTRNLKLSTRYYDPFQVVQKLAKVAYKLNLPPHSWIHPVFHVSLLKKHIGEGKVVQATLPNVNMEENGKFPILHAILDRRVRKRKEKVLIHWQGLSPAEATWEEQQLLKNQFTELTL